MPSNSFKLNNDPDWVKYTQYEKKSGNFPDLPRTPPSEWKPLLATTTQAGRVYLRE